MKKKYVLPAVGLIVALSVPVTRAQQPGWQGQFNIEGLEDLDEMIAELQKAFGGNNGNFNFQQFGQHLQNLAPQAERGPRTYLGVRLAPVSPDVAHHLDLPAGFFQTVKSVEPDSPAAKAGIEAFDIITQVDDQKIINAQQLVQLIAGKSDGDKVEVTVLRKGKKQQLTATLAQTEAPPPRQGFGLGGGGQNLQDMMRQLQQQFGQMQQPKGGGAPQPDIIIEEDNQGNRTTRMQSSSRSSMVHTDQGQFKFTEENGNKTFKVTDADGEVAFDGPVNTKAEREKVPADFRDQLEQMDQGGGLHNKAPGRRSPPMKKKRMPL